MNGLNPDDKLEGCPTAGTWDGTLFNGVVGFCNMGIDGRTEK